MDVRGDFVSLPQKFAQPLSQVGNPLRGMLSQLLNPDRQQGHTLTNVVVEFPCDAAALLFLRIDQLSIRGLQRLLDHLPFSNIQNLTNKILRFTVRSSNQGGTAFGVNRAPAFVPTAFLESLKTPSGCVTSCTVMRSSSSSV